MKQRSIEWGDQVAEAAERSILGTVGLGKAGTALESAVDALKSQAEVLKGCKLEESVKCKCGLILRLPLNAKDLAQTMAYTAKMIDEVARLVEFSKGGPDSRPDLGTGSFLEILDEEQLATLNNWVKSNRAKLIEEVKDGNS